MAPALVVLLVACGRGEHAGADSPSAPRPAAASAASCSVGYVRRGDACVDLDECAQVATPCGTPQASCRNFEGGYDCTCPAGYVGGGPTGLACAPRVAAGGFGTCVVPADGSPQCVGLDNTNRAFRAEPLPGFDPARFSDTDVVAVSTSQPDHSCMLHRDGHVSCWGNNDMGQLGIGNREWRFPPADVPGLQDVVAIDTDSLLTCAIRRGGGLYCWGSIVGMQFPAPADLTRPTRMPIDDVVQVTVGDGAVCALRRNGTILCGGAGNREFVEVRGVDDAVRIERGTARRLALRRSGTVVAWGFYGDVEIDPSWSPPNAWTPRVLTGLDDVVDLSAYSSSYCYLTRSHAMFCDGL